MGRIRLLAIDRAEPELARACKKFARDFGLEIEAFLLVSTNFKETPAYHGNETDGYFYEILCDFDDTETLTKILNEIASERTVFHCRMEEAIKDYAKVIPLVPHALAPTVESLVMSTEKSKMRRNISDKFPEICPKFVVLNNFAEFNDGLMTGFNFPVIVKPNGLHSSFFVTRCNDMAELTESLDMTFKSLDEVYAREYGTGQPSLLIEEFMSGEMYSVDAYVDPHGKATCLPPVRVITAAELGLDGYYSYRHIIPTTLSDDETQKANLCSEQAIQALGLTSSTVHVELYKTLNGWKIIELGPRIGGYRQDLYTEAFGIDHYYNDLLVHFGKQPDVIPKWNRHAAGLNIYAESEGIIESIQGLEAAREISSVVYLELNANVGDAALFCSNGGQFIVEGILSNDSPETLEKHVKLVRDTIKIVVT